MAHNNASYNHHQLHRHLHQANTKTFFLPMFCRLSIRDAVKPAKWSDRSSSSSSSSSPDPSSPKISCIGQIKKRSITTNNNRIMSCPISNTFSSASASATAAAKSSSGGTNTNLSYTKLRKLFSGKNLISATADITSINHNRQCVSKTGRVRRPISRITDKQTSDDGRDLVRVVVLEELDPPLPVVKCRRGDDQGNVNLCKRRGIELKTLQIQLPLNHNNNSKTFFSASSNINNDLRINGHPQRQMD